jgi:hypothetical protein
VKAGGARHFGRVARGSGPRFNSACPPSHARKRSPSERCAPPACAAFWSIARTTTAAIPSRSARTNGLITSGFLISNRGSCAKPAASEGPTSGRTSVGTSRQSRRWAIVSALVWSVPLGEHLCSQGLGAPANKTPLQAVTLTPTLHHDVMRGVGQFVPRYL